MRSCYGLGADIHPCDGEKADVAKIDPISYDPINHAYLRFGEAVGKAFNIGRTLPDAVPREVA